MMMRIFAYDYRLTEDDIALIETRTFDIEDAFFDKKNVSIRSSANFFTQRSSLGYVSNPPMYLRYLNGIFEICKYNMLTRKTEIIGEVRLGTN